MDGYNFKKRIRASKGMEPLDSSYIVDGHVKWCVHFGKQFDSCTKISSYFITQ